MRVKTEEVDVMLHPSFDEAAKKAAIANGLLIAWPQCIAWRRHGHCHF